MTWGRPKSNPFRIGLPQTKQSPNPHPPPTMASFPLENRKRNCTYVLPNSKNVIEHKVLYSVRSSCWVVSVSEVPY